MTLGELKELVDQMLESGAPEDTEVRIAHQPSYPFELSIQDVELIDFSEPEYDGDGEVIETEAQTSPPVVYIAEGSQLGYLPGIASTTFGWR